MGEKGTATNAVARNLRDAIDRVREDMAKVEFWADAIAGFSQPVPDYEPEDVSVWVPPEQGMRISPGKRDRSQEHATSKRG